jgi:WD40 repeat protein
MHCAKCGQEWPDGSAVALAGGCPSCLLNWALDDLDPALSNGTPEDAPLEHLGPYTILETLGRGGLGTVYRARHQALGHVVALKILHRDTSLLPGFATRLQREGQVLGVLNHPNIIGVRDLGCEAGVFYLAMECVSGKTLRQLLVEQGRLSWRRAAAIMAPLCDAVQHAHDHGIVHRDIKPENILIDDDGKVRLGDFGIARLIQGDDPAGARLTRATAVLGTQGYMAPEQYEPGRTIDQRADIFALGVVLYEMLTGELPAGVFPPPSRATGVDPRVDAIVLKALEKDPARRQPSAAALGAAIRASAEPSSSKKRSFARAAVVAGLLLLMVAGVSALLFARSGNPETNTTPEPAVPPYRELAGHGGKVWGVAFARDGQTLATASEDKTLRLWDPATGKLKSTLPAYPRGEVGPLAVDFSPGTRFVATGGGEGTIRIWNVEGAVGKPGELTGHGREVTALVFGPNIDRLASASYDRSVRVWNLRTAQPVVTYSEFQDPVLSLAWSPDGKMLAAGAMNGAIRLLDPNTGKVLGEAGHAKRVWALAFSPDSQTLASGGHDGVVKLWPLPRVGSPPARDLAEGPEVWSLAFSPKGPLLAVGSRDGIIRLWNPDAGSIVHRLTHHKGPVVSLAFSPDGRYLVSGSWDHTAVVWDMEKVMAAGE